ncbi:MAG: hypothetical protein OCD00_14840 [Colwellia sp.]
MNKNLIPKFIGVFVSFFIIWLINDFTLIDSCLEQGGKFDYHKGACLLENGEVYQSGLEMPLFALYAFIGFFVTFFVSKFINKIFTRISRVKTIDNIKNQSF